MPKLKYTRKRHSSSQNARYKKKADVSSTSTRKLINKCSQKNILAKSTNTLPFDDSLENSTLSLLNKNKKTTTKPNIISEQPMPSLADLEKMFEDSENSEQMSLTTSITSEKCEKNQLNKKNNTNVMPLSMDKTVNESSTSSNNTTVELEPVNRNSNFQNKKAFDKKPSSIAVPCRTYKTNHTNSKIINCQNPSRMRTHEDLSNVEDDHVNNTGTSRRHHRMSHDSFPLPSTSRDDNSVLNGSCDGLQKYGVEAPDFQSLSPKHSKESNRLISEVISNFLSNPINDGMFEKISVSFKIKPEFIQHETRNNPIYSYVNEHDNPSQSYCCDKIEVNSGNILREKSKQKSKSSQINLGKCPICMDCLSNRVVVSTFCGHIFCMVCITAAFAANGRKCPTCRKGLSNPGYHPLYL
ncbi:unnamed protein product [Parnassius apollo]|uniref:(apollo) hypothetical protein n=1 Tax=Parnassius apollo TaxID=110799 RepID=A0A8S3XVE6_PARAO|nr:unnamed protein product [Parnassius apollo]